MEEKSFILTVEWRANQLNDRGYDKEGRDFYGFKNGGKKWHTDLMETLALEYEFEAFDYLR